VVGNVNKLGSYFSDAAGAAYLDEEGQPRSIIMGSYGIDVSKLMATIAEEFHDDQGLIWPAAITPYPLHLVVLASRDGSTEKTAETFYEALIKSGLEPLYDDREERAGVKFNDADLIGIPLRITISTRSLKFGGFEFKRRTQDEHWIVPPEKAIETIMGEMDLR
jgi:prolyl-tRNA synthetase